MTIKTLTSIIALSTGLVFLGVTVTYAAPAPSPATAEAHASSESASSMQDTAASKYQSVLQSRLKENSDGIALFDYAGAKQSGDLAIIKKFIDTESARKPSQMNASEAMVYWANLYNAVTLAVVLENYPVKSIRDIKSGFRSGPWKRDLVTVEGKDLSLDNIEHDILRKKYPSPFIHYMVNCASIGCPNLIPGLWTVDNLNTDQEAGARAFLATRRGVKLDKDGDLIVSSIYDWFDNDFGGKTGVLQHIQTYGPAEIKAAIADGAKIDDDDYDWSLNE